LFKDAAEKGYEVWLKRQEDKQRLRGQPNHSSTEESTSCEKRGKAEWPEVRLRRLIRKQRRLGEKNAER
jgi:hypothetical protein